MSCESCKDTGLVLSHTKCDDHTKCGPGCACLEPCLECRRGGAVVGNHEVAAPKPGIYRGVDFDSYAAWDAVNSHLLIGFSRTPAHVRHDLVSGGKDRTDALDFGWLVHQAVLEPEAFASFGAGQVVAPHVDRRTKAGKQAWAEFLAANEGREVVEAAEYAKLDALRRKVLACRDALHAHPSAGEWLQSKGTNELSIVWLDAETGILCKARIDRVGRIGEWPIVGDLKTARSAARGAFEKAIHNFSYHVQASHYLAGLQALSPVPAGAPFRRFVFAVVESEAPHCVAVYELAEEALAAAEDDRRRYLRTWKQCIETGVWPAYGDGIDLVSLPPWAFKAMGDAA